jgi:hypothetical protein
VQTRRRFVYALLASGLSLVLCEGLLQIAARTIPFVKYQVSPPWNRNRVPDPEFGYRNSPFFPGHDRRGYRNDDALDHYDILAIGDSSTYGFGASAEGSWPRQLRTLSGRTVYNGGVGGYGPCEYLRVAEELSVLKPKLVILALYLGNDLADAYGSVVLERRCPILATTDAAVVAAMQQADEKATLRDLFVEFETTMMDPPQTFWKRSALYGLARSLVNRLQTTGAIPFRHADDTFQAAASRPFRVPMESPDPYRTVFVDPRLYELAIDLNDPRIAEGLRITLEAIKMLQTSLEQRGVPLVVALIHNKPFVMAPVLERDRLDLFPRFQRLIGLEARATEAVSRWLSSHRIRFLDTGDHLRAEVLSGRMLFAESDDHHPTSVGYGAIAAAIFEFVKGPMPPLTAPR